MTLVSGIGGLFFRAENPEALAAWYAEHLEIPPPDPMPWTQKGGIPSSPPSPPTPITSRKTVPSC